MSERWEVREHTYTNRYGWDVTVYRAECDGLEDDRSFSERWLCEERCGHLNNVLALELAEDAWTRAEAKRKGV